MLFFQKINMKKIIQNLTHKKPLQAQFALRETHRHFLSLRRRTRSHRQSPITHTNRAKHHPPQSLPPPPPHTSLHSAQHSQQHHLRRHLTHPRHGLGASFPPAHHSPNHSHHCHPNPGLALCKRIPYRTLPRRHPERWLSTIHRVRVPAEQDRFGPAPIAQQQLNSVDCQLSRSGATGPRSSSAIGKRSETCCTSHSRLSVS